MISPPRAEPFPGTRCRDCNRRGRCSLLAVRGFADSSPWSGGAPMRLVLVPAGGGTRGRRRCQCGGCRRWRSCCRTLRPCSGRRRASARRACRRGLRRRRCLRRCRCRPPMPCPTWSLRRRGRRLAGLSSWRRCLCHRGRPSRPARGRGRRMPWRGSARRIPNARGCRRGSRQKGLGSWP